MLLQLTYVSYQILNPSLYNQTYHVSSRDAQFCRAAHDISEIWSTEAHNEECLMLNKGPT